MLLKKTIHKTKNLVQKCLQNLKSHVFGGYQKLSRAPSMNLFSARSIDNPKLHKLEDSYRDFCDHLESDPIEATTTTPTKSKSHTILTTKEENASSKSPMDDTEKTVLKKRKGEKRGGNAENKIANSNNGLAQKMRELEMMDVHDDDVDHVLDVEEVLHYYSRLKSPIYQDLVDKFFMDMYSDFSAPKPSAKPTINSSMHRLGPLKISTLH